MQDNHLIFGVHVTNRGQNATTVQEVFTKYGCFIKTRIGLHDVSETECSPSGVILLEMFGDADTCAQAYADLLAIDGVEVQQMLFDHP